MLGAIIGDIAGSRFEFHNHKSKEFEFFTGDCSFTDDSVMTLAVAKAIMACRGNWSGLEKNAVTFMRKIGREYPDCGFGGMFRRWMFDDEPEPYNSFGNGAAMRVSPCAFAAESEEEALELARKVTAVTHGHRKGIRGAEATTLAIFMARRGALKDEIRSRLERDYYPLNFTLDSIREDYSFDETCQGSVPQAIEAFLESVNFEDAIRNAVSIGGDSDTIAAITGSIAEAYYGVPLKIKRRALSYLDSSLRGIFSEWERFYQTGKPRREFDTAVKYIDKLDSVHRQRDFFYEFAAFVTMNRKYGARNYRDILKANDLEWTEESMKHADPDALDETAVLALITGVYEAESFSDGVFGTFVNEGFIYKWLGRLKTLDDERPASAVLPVVTELRIRITPFSKKGASFYEARHELLLSEKRLVIKIASQDGVIDTHEHEFSRVSEAVCESLDSLAVCLCAEGWQDDRVSYRNDRELSRVYELEAEYEDGSKIRHDGLFDRVHIPEKPFLAFLESLRGIVQPYELDEMLELPSFMAAMRAGEVKYCGVEFGTYGNAYGKLYHYRTSDLRIKVGDHVVAPVGKDNDAQVVTVRTVEFHRWDDTPYPIEKTKVIFHLAGEEEQDFTPARLPVDSRILPPATAQIE